MKTLTLMEATLEAENEVRKLTVMYDYVPKNSTCTCEQYNIIFLCSKLYNNNNNANLIMNDKCVVFKHLNNVKLCHLNK